MPSCARCVHREIKKNPASYNLGKAPEMGNVSSLDALKLTPIGSGAAFSGSFDRMAERCAVRVIASSVCNARTDERKLKHLFHRIAKVGIWCAFVVRQNAATVDLATRERASGALIDRPRSGAPSRSLGIAPGMSRSFSIRRRGGHEPALGKSEHGRRPRNRDSSPTVNRPCSASTRRQFGNTAA
ncbi:hypothetical protein ACVWXO_009430 [Bradyrhizobium sp. LM2.7]